jgi:DNA-binding MarR family transcriptional regulator
VCPDVEGQPRVSSRSGGSDHVDRVRAEWRVVRPDLDTSPIAVVARVGRLAAYFDQAINTIMGRYGLTRSTWDILASLRRQPAPHQLSPTELYRALMRSSGWMTNRLHELERVGLIKRVSDPDDRRGVLVRLTCRGVALVDEVAPLHLRNERALLDPLSRSERKQLEDLLRSLLGPLEEAQPSPPRRQPRVRKRRKSGH